MRLKIRLCTNETCATTWHSCQRKLVCQHVTADCEVYHFKNTSIIFSPDYEQLEPQIGKVKTNNNVF